MNIEYLITHSGGFHADELLSSVVLTSVFLQLFLKSSHFSTAFFVICEKSIVFLDGFFMFSNDVFTL